MTPTYAEAVERLTEALRASDEIGAPEVYCTRETARAILAGPSEQDVARVISSNPAYLAEVRDEQQTWLADHLAQALAPGEGE